MRKSIILLCSILLLNCVYAQVSESNTNTAPFSFDELNSSEEIPLPPLKYIEAGDQTKLAYREYRPDQTTAVLLFYHGGGAHSAASYENIGSKLSEDYNIAVITPDLRGHGASEGERGDTPTVEQIFEDVNSFIRFIRLEFPDKPLFLGGHSSGGGMVLNYSDFQLKDEVEGYIFLSPQLGFRSKTAREDNPNPFAIVKESYFIENARFGKYGNKKAVFFNYPESVLKKDPNLITAITVNMSNAITPSSPAEQIQAIDLPLAVWIGQKDELLDSDKVITFVKKNNPEAYTEIVEGENHLSIILSASDYIGNWIINNLSR